jgi:hypothetical protein
MATGTKTRGKRDNPYQLDDLFVTVHRSPAGTAWRWRTEITTLTGLVAALLWLASRLHSITWAAVVLAAALGALFTVPFTRRLIVRRFWCVLSRHRFHRMCFEGRLHTRAGRVPPVLWVRPTKVGERLFIWVRAGLSAEDFAERTDELRAASYARDARVTRNMSWSQLATIDIIRRDTLAASHAPSSPYKKLLAERARAALAAPAPVSDDTDDPGQPGPSPWPQATPYVTD